MKIKDILGEEVKMVVKDFKPGVSLSMVDPTTDTMTVVDLKKNPTALQTSPDGEFMYDPTPDSAAPGEPKQPELKPGAEIGVDTTTSEEVDDEQQATGADKDLGNGFTLTTTEFNGKMVPAVFDSEGNRHWIKNDSGDRQYGMSQFITIQNGKAVGSNPGPITAAALKQAGMQTAAPAAPASLAWNQMTPDQQAAFRAKQQADDAAAQGGQNIQNYLANKRRTPTTPSNEEGYAPGTALDVKNERMDESAVITALARRIAGTEVKSKTKSKEVFDIKKLAGL